MPRYAIKTTHQEIVDHMFDCVIEDRKQAIIKLPERREIFERDLTNLEENKMRELIQYFPNVWEGKPAYKDFKKIEVDLENVDWIQGESYMYGEMTGFQNIDDFNFIGVGGGGDWEFPVYFILYLDEKGLRCYIPKNGNAYNKKRKAAFGNYEVDDDGNETDEFLEDSEIEEMIDFEAMKQDISNRIKVR